MPSPSHTFIQKIDCAFPYHDEAAGYALADEALQYGDEAVYKLMEELARVPYSERQAVDTAHLLRLLDYLLARFTHPLAPMLADVTRLMIAGKELTVAEAITRMEMVRPYIGLDPALAILYDSCDDTEGRANAVFDSITGGWYA